MSVDFEEDDNELLSRYLSEQETIDPLWVKHQVSEDVVHSVTITEYTLRSQYWPQGEASAALWEHTLIIYHPHQVDSASALLFINGGTRHMHGESDKPLPQHLNFARIAAQARAVVIDLQDVPNQYLMLDNQPRKGDALLAYTWKHYLKDPLKNEYWPLYFPMTKAVIKAMDAVQNIFSAEKNLSIEKFILTGLSKRGLATWLAALSDDRVQAIIPIVIDILNTTTNLAHIYTSYNNQWPPAFEDFQFENLMADLNSKAFARLMNLMDPLSYLHSKNTIYKKRLSVPKYIISASGDDFFVPDSVNLYLQQLPGETCLRVVPNQGHFIDLDIVENALLSYYKMIVQQKARPTLRWQTDKRGVLCQVVTDKAPVAVKLWQAENLLRRDFRFVSGITYHAQALQVSVHQGQFYGELRVAVPQQGWTAHFVEVSFACDGGERFILTTPSYVIGCYTH
jgi:PhoPQ-activated pathogenicity-related protein